MKAVRMGLAWLEEQGLIRAAFDGGAARISLAGRANGEVRGDAVGLRAELEEARAFRHHIAAASAS